MVKEKEKTNENKEVIKYPSAEFLYSVCLDDYHRLLSNYDKIYDRINFALAFCGVVIFFILKQIDFSVLYEWAVYTPIEKIAIVIYLMMTLSSTVLIIISTIKLLLIARSKNIDSFDSRIIGSKELYYEKVEDVSLWIIDKYLIVIDNLREIIIEKQSKYNTAIIMIVISLITCVFSVIIHRGGLL